MDVSLFDYFLPDARIAQSPLPEREQAKLLVLNRTDESFSDQHIFDLPHLLEPGDLLVFNDSKVFKARLVAYAEPPRETSPKKEFELFLLHPNTDNSSWSALLRNSRKIESGQPLFLADGSRITVLSKGMDGVVQLDTHRSPQDVFALCERLGEVPTPPYVKQPVAHPDDYQTVYAKQVGSVAAPTAGFHFTHRLLEELEGRGIEKAFVTLHVGLGTFRPMKSETLEEHQMHQEWISVSEAVCQKILATKKRGGKVIAVGTTSTRALEAAAQNHTGQAIAPFEGFTNLFITPGYTFRVIDGLITNFHLPKSTLLVLVSTLAGRDLMLKAYQHAIEHAYRFYSFGDAMLIR